MHEPNARNRNNIRFDLFLENWRRVDATHLLKWNMSQFCAALVNDL